MNRTSVSLIGLPISVILVASAVILVSSAKPAHALNSYSIDIESSSSQYLSAADASVFDLTNNLTIEAWVKFESTTGQQAIVGKYDGGGDGKSYYLYYNGSTDELIFTGRETETTYGCSDLTTLVSWNPSSGTWYHVAVTKNGTAVKFYVDGSQQGSDKTCTTQNIKNGDADLQIGAVDGANLLFDGLIDEVRLWNIARSQTEISDDRLRELNGNEDSLVGYWKLNNSFTDYTANGNTLSNNNSASFSAGTPFSGFAEVTKVRKTQNESVTSSTQPQDDNELKLSLNSNTSYIIDGVIFASSTSATPDIKIRFDGQTGVDIAVGYTNDLNEMVLVSGEESNVIALPANTPTSIHIKGTVKTGSTSGDFQLKWAQNTSNGNPTTVMKGSYLRADEI